MPTSNPQPSLAALTPPADTPLWMGPIAVPALLAASGGIWLVVQVLVSGVEAWPAIAAALTLMAASTVWLGYCARVYQIETDTASGELSLVLHGMLGERRVSVPLASMTGVRVLEESTLFGPSHCVLIEKDDGPAVRAACVFGKRRAARLAAALQLAAATAGARY